jgi:hypothetical protein
MNRRFEIGPLLIAIGSLVLLVALFLRWYGPADAWHAFELADLLLAALAVACLGMAVALAVPELPGPEPRALPWLVGAALVVVVAELLNPPPTVAVTHLGAGAWLALAATCVMAVGALLTVGRVSLAVAVEGRDLRRRVPAVDHREPAAATEPEAPPPAAGRPRPSEPLLDRKDPEPTEEA